MVNMHTHSITDDHELTQIYRMCRAEVTRRHRRSDGQSLREQEARGPWTILDPPMNTSAEEDCQQKGKLEPWMKWIPVDYGLNINIFKYK